MCDTICQLEPDEGPTTLRTAFCKADFLIFFTWQLNCDSGNCMTTLELPKLRIGYFFSIAISKQINAAPYFQYKHWQLLREGSVPAVHWLVNLWFHMCTSFAPRPITVALGLGTRLHVHMHTTLQNGVLHNGQQPGRAVLHISAIPT